MTDEMRAREKAICEVAKVDDIGEVSDGFHTFNSLYEQRMILFAALVKAYKDKSWKSYRHEDGEYCFGGGWFIVGIDTPEGSYTYHYENKYWDMFDCTDLPRAKHWDGHTEADAETRLLSLPERKTDRDMISRQAAIEAIKKSRFLVDAMEKVIKLPSAQPEPLTDKEQRIFLAAMGREEKVCKEVDAEMTREPYEDSLVKTCHEIIRKVKGALWT